MYTVYYNCSINYVVDRNSDLGFVKWTLSTYYFRSFSKKNVFVYKTLTLYTYQLYTT